MIRAAVRARPVAIGLVVAIIAISVASAVVGASGGDVDALHRRWGIDPALLVHGGLLPGLVTGLLIPAGPIQAALSVIVVLVVTAGAEPRLGHLRTLWIFFASGVTGTVVGILLQVVGLATHRIAAGPPMTLVVLDPTIGAAGVAFATSAFVGPLWRRRIRVLGAAALAVAMLYSGGPADLYRIAAAAAGGAIGALLTLDRPRTELAPRSSHNAARSLVAGIVAITAAGPLVAGLTPRGWGLLRPTGELVRGRIPAGVGADRWCHLAHTAAQCRHEYAALTFDPGAHALSALPLVVLGLAAIGLWRGRRIAAVAAILVELLYAVLGAVYFNLLPLFGAPAAGRGGVTTAQAVLAVLVPLAVATVIALNLRHLTVGTSLGARRVAAAVAAAAVAGPAAVYLVLASTWRAEFTPRPRPTDLLADLPERFVPIGFLRLRRADFVPTGPAARLLWEWTGPVAWAGIAVALAICLVAVRERSAGRDVARVRALLRQASVGPVAGMAVWAGNRYWFGADGRHAVAYRVVGTVAITVGEPIGPQEGAIEAARAFTTACEDLGLTAVFYTVRPEFAASIGSGAAWRTVPIGEDAVIDLRSFSLTGKRWSDIRSSINRAERAGIRAEWTTWDESPLSRRLQIEAISEDWASERRLPEMTFTLGGLQELRDPDTRLLLAVDAAGRVEAVTSWLPSWQDGREVGLTLDLMRRRPGGMNGAMEFLIASAALDAQRRGLAFLSLSASPLAGAHLRSETAADRALARLARLLEPAYGFRSLATFKDKFQPQPRPLVMAFPDRIALPAIAIGLLHAYLPDVAPKHLFSLLGSHRAQRRLTRLRPAAENRTASTPR